MNKMLSLSIVPVVLMGLIMSSGCTVVSSDPATTGVLEVRWDNSTGNCEQLGVRTVSIRVTQNGTLMQELTGILCSSGSRTMELPFGSYAAVIRGVGAGGQTLATVNVSGLVVTSSQRVSTELLLFSAGNQLTGNASLTFSWTVAGQAPSVGCAGAGLSTVVASLVDPSTKEIVASTPDVDCANGSMLWESVPAGTYSLQLDGKNSNGLVTFGNVPLTEPFLITANTALEFSSVIDLTDFSSSVSLNWSFSNGATCGANNIEFVFIEITDANGEVLVSMNAKDATFPCAIGPGTPLTQRLIDVRSETPTCNVPPNTQGLVICGITDTKVGIRISTLNATTQQITQGGSMSLESIPSGQHSVISDLLVLSPCNGVSNICASPR
jgi:hypothetical protein